MEDYYNDMKLGLHWFPFMPVKFLNYTKVFKTSLTTTKVWYVDFSSNGFNI